MDLWPFKQVYTLSIVIIGNFNPSIVQPFWFSSKGLIREQEAQDAKVEVIHPELVKWSLSWMTIEVSRSRFEIRSTQEPYFEPIRDLLLSLVTALKETPISAFGLNHLIYFAIPDEDRYTELGNKLVPLNNWNKIFENPKVFNVDIGEERKDGLKGSFRVRVQPSDIKLSSPYGILINSNDHYDISSQVSTESTSRFKSILNQNWTVSLERAKNACIEIGNI
jgi:hypothetical protein